MSKHHLSLIAAAMALSLLLTACGNGSASASSSAPAPGASSSQPSDPAVSVIKPVDPQPGASSSVTPAPGASSVVIPPDVSVVLPEPEYINPLTGEKTVEDLTAKRPIAVMLNNLKKALPQCGVSQADIIFEAPVEGGITRMLAVFQSTDGVGNIGTVRSARPYYLDMALGLDAIFLHAGASGAAYTAIKEWGVTALDCVHGPYEGSLFWRDQARWAEDGMEHSVFTSGDTICDLVPTYASVRQDHEEGYSLPLTFTMDGTPQTGVTAETISVKYSGTNSTTFSYRPDMGKYLVEEYGSSYLDGNNMQQVAVTNVLVLFTDVSRIPNDSAGRLDVRMTGTGTGYFACGGKFIDINWSKPTVDSPFQFTTATGEELLLGVGRSYINIVDDSYPVAIS